MYKKVTCVGLNVDTLVALEYLAGCTPILVAPPVWRHSMRGVPKWYASYQLLNSVQITDSGRTGYTRPFGLVM